MKRESSFCGLIAALLSVVSLTGCDGDKPSETGGSGGNFAGSSGSNFDSSDLEPLCAIAPNALALAVRAIARGRQSFEGVKEFVGSQGTGVVITGSCKALVTGLIHNPNKPLSFDLKLPQGVVDDLTNTRTGLMECLNWPVAADRVRCFAGEIPPPQ